MLCKYFLNILFYLSFPGWSNVFFKRSNMGILFQLRKNQTSRLVKLLQQFNFLKRCVWNNFRYFMLHLVY